MQLTFLGGTGTVTGSKYLLEYGGGRVLIDCGLFQGLKQLRLKNWAPFPIPPAGIDAVILTHAHLDHSGYLPRLVKEGFSGTVYCTPATKDLCRILLLDSAMIMTEEAEHARRHGYSKHENPQPLYTEEDVLKAMRLFRSVPWDKSFELAKDFSIAFRRAGHILGAASVHIRNRDASLAFSGDLGRMRDPMFPPPENPPDSDFLVVESTYGDRLHEDVDPSAQLQEVIGKTLGRGGVLLVPSFAVGRTQALLLRLWELKQAGKIPGCPIYVDSPMASNVTKLYSQHLSDHALSEDQCEKVFGMAHYTQSGEESQRLSRSKIPMILISASGMATGGRVLHHLKAFAPDPRNTILLAGYQAAGTRGAALANGADRVKIHGQYIPVRAEVSAMQNFSAHADAGEIVQWLKSAPRRPGRLFITHGEPMASEALRQRIKMELGWEGEVPEFRDTCPLMVPPGPGLTRSPA